METNEKENAEQALKNVYFDCVNFTKWDTFDEDNWEAMVLQLERVAKYMGVQL